MIEKAQELLGSQRDQYSTLSGREALVAIAIKAWNASAALFAQIGRIMAINSVPTVTSEVVTLARERLVDGPL